MCVYVLSNMVAGTKRGLLLFGLHTFSVHILFTVFISLYVEYYVHECLLHVKAQSTNAESDKKEAKAQLSKWGLSFFVLAQVTYAVLSVLHRCGLFSFFSSTFSIRHAFLLPYQLPSEHCFALLFGLSWSLLRFPLLPSAVTFTVVFAALSALSDRCVVFMAQAAREMALQRPKEGERIDWVGRLATTSGAAAVFVAALLYDGAAPRRGQLGGFHAFVAITSLAMLGMFSALQHLRRRAQADEGTAAFTACEEAADGGGSGGGSRPPRLPLSSPDVSSAHFRAFARQTCQRRSMKALLVVRAFHGYAHTLVLHFFHLILTLGGGMRLSAAVRAALLALVVAVSSILGPFSAALCAVLGKKRSFSLGCALVSLAGAVSLLFAYLTRDSSNSATAAASPGAALSSVIKQENLLVEVSTTGTTWCVIMVVVQRLLLDVVRDVLDLAQEDVVEEDAILFGRASSMATWTRRLTSVGSVPLQSLSFIATLLFLAASRAFRLVWCGQSAASAPLPGGFAVSTTTTTTAMPFSPLDTTPWLIAANGSTMLALLGMQTCGVAMTMWVVWQRFYNLDGKYLHFVQMATRKRKDEQAVALV